MRKWFLCILVAGAVTGSSVNAGYGDPTSPYDSLPSWHERSLLVLTNACRCDPVAFRDLYIGNSTILLPANYPPVTPLHWNLALNRSARAHAVDMATSCGLQHNSCDGTTWSTRIKTYYKTSPSIAENIAYGRSDALGTIKQWILDGTQSSPAADKSGADGHRKNIMNGSFRELGTGHGTGTRGSSISHYWVQDFGGATSAYRTFVIPAASHLFFGTTNTTFMANYYDAGGAGPRDATVVIAGTRHTMTLQMGKAAHGNYMFEIPRASSCRQYYFQFTDNAGKTWRYPESGFLVTQGEGSCTQSYSAAEQTSLKSAGFSIRQAPPPEGDRLKAGVPGIDLRGRRLSSEPGRLLFRDDVVIW